MLSCLMLICELSQTDDFKRKGWTFYVNNQTYLYAPFNRVLWQWKMCLDLSRVQKLWIFEFWNAKVTATSTKLSFCCRLCENIFETISLTYSMFKDYILVKIQRTLKFWSASKAVSNLEMIYNWIDRFSIAVTLFRSHQPT